MASYRKRGGRWQAIVRKTGHEPQSRAFDTKAQAVAWAVKTEAELDAGRKPGSTQSFREAAIAYERDAMPHKRGKRWEEIRLRKILREWKLADRPIASITPEQITAWASASPLQPTSVIREAALLSAVFTFARRTLRWISVSPMGDAILPAPPKPRKQRITDEQALAIATACGYVEGQPLTTVLQRVAVAFLFAMETMMRAGEICAIRPEHRKGRIVHLPSTKNGDERDVPLSTRAAQLLDVLPKNDPLFGLGANSMGTQFRSARKQAALRMPSVATIHFHDARREAATRLSKKLDVMELGRMGGWRDINMLYRVYYAADVQDTLAKLG